MAQTKIEWATTTWNPVTGCSSASEGCLNCYARRMANRLRGRYGYPVADPFQVTYHPDRIDIGLFRPDERVFVCSMGDLFHNQVLHAWQHNVFRVMSCHMATEFFVLTKRPHNMRDFVISWFDHGFLLPNVRLGVTCENQCRAEKRIIDPVSWVSCEPLLGRINILDHLGPDKINWVVIGPETGPGRRECDPEWIEDLVRQCEAAEVPYFVKAFPMPDGRISKNMDEWPEWARVRQYPA